MRKLSWITTSLSLRHSSRRSRRTQQPLPLHLSRSSLVRKPSKRQLKKRKKRRSPLLHHISSTQPMLILPNKRHTMRRDPWLTVETRLPSSGKILSLVFRKIRRKNNYIDLSSGMVRLRKAKRSFGNS